MSVERKEISRNQVTTFVDTAMARGLTFFEAYLGFEDVTRAEVDHLEAAIKLNDEQRLVGGSVVEDQCELAKAIAAEKETAYRLNIKSDLFGQRRALDKNLATAYYDVKASITKTTGVSTILESGSGFGGIVDLFDAVRQDYRVPLVELALQVARDPIKKEAFEYLKKLKEIDQRRNYTESKEQQSVSVVQKWRLLTEASEKGFMTNVNSLDGEFGAVVEKFGAIGPYAEQFIIETIENILDPDLKKQRDIRAGKAPSKK